MPNNLTKLQEKIEKESDIIFGGATYPFDSIENEVSIKNNNLYKSFLSSAISQAYQAGRSDMKEEIRKGFPNGSFTGDGYELGWNQSLKFIEDLLNNIE